MTGHADHGDRALRAVSALHGRILRFAFLQMSYYKRLFLLLSNILGKLYRSSLPL